MSSSQSTEIAIVGSGIAGIAAAYYLATKYDQHAVTLIDSRAPMSFTSAQSGDNYRNWWPHPVMAEFTDYSIDLMEALARDTSDAFSMMRRGYLLATRRTNIDDLLADLDQGIDNSVDRKVRVHTDVNSGTYRYSPNEHWSQAPDGVDVLSSQALIRNEFPSFSDDISNLVHIRRAGEFNSQQLGQHMLERIRALGTQRILGDVKNIERNGSFVLDVVTENGAETVKADVVINAAGPFARNVAEMLGVRLPVSNVFQQKLAFEDSLGAIPRDLPFSIDLDEQMLDWTDDERGMLEEDSGLSWLAEPVHDGVHRRPDGATTGRWVKLGWAYNTVVSEPQQDLANEPCKIEIFPEIVVRAAAALTPSLRQYLQSMPTRRSHYGGYYTMTDENWPLIGPTDIDGFFVIAALSGFGSMAACAAGSICADWVAGEKTPSFAAPLSLSRYEDTALMSDLRSRHNKGLL